MIGDGDASQAGMHLVDGSASARLLDFLEVQALSLAELPGLGKRLHRVPRVVVALRLEDRPGRGGDGHVALRRDIRRNSV